MSSCHKEYLGEPVSLKAWRFAKDEYKQRLSPGKYPWYKPQYSVEFEINYLLDKVFPT